MNPAKMFAYDRALGLVASNPQEAFRLLLASDEEDTSNDDQEGEGQDDQEEQGQQGQGEQKTAADMGLDPSQEELFDALLLIAENDGSAYKKRDADMAVAAAWAEWKKEHDQTLREDFRSIQRKLIKALQDQWKRHEAESRRASESDNRRASEPDNSFGRGYYPLPPQLAGLGRFVSSLRPNNLIDHKVWPDEGTHMLTARVDPKLSVMAADMKSLLKLGLVRVQCNDPGTLSFYFQVQA
jgi:hypothetical protein